MLYLLVLILLYGCSSKCEVTDIKPLPSITVEKTCEKGSVFPQRIRFGITSYGEKTQVHSAWKPILLFLESRIGLPIEFTIFEQYEDLIFELTHNNIELSILPPLAYVIARRNSPCLNLLRTKVGEGSVYYSGYILVRSDSFIQSLHDLKGKRIGFVEKASASGYLFAITRLIDAGFDPLKDLQNAIFLGSHNKLIMELVNGNIDAGATFYGGIQEARIAGNETRLLRILSITGRIPHDALVANQSLHPDVIKKITGAFDQINSTTAEGRKLLSGFQDMSGWVETDDSVYDSVRQTLAVLTSLEVNIKE